MPDTVDRLEDLRRVLHRDHGLSRRATSKSAVIDAIVHSLPADVRHLAEWLRSRS